MGIFKFDGVSPEIASDVFVANSADIMGKVKIASGASIWFNTVIRGDVNRIEIGERTNIQDLSMLHVAGEFPLIIGNDVTVGHHVNLHACTVGDRSLIGIGAIILDGAKIGEESVVAAGSLVPPGKEFPPRSLIMGAPAKRVRELTKEEIEAFQGPKKTYMDLAQKYRKEIGC